MSLAAVRLTFDEFDEIYDHVLNYKPKYGNMHMRQRRTIKGKADLRYFHIMTARPNREIHGMISGPDIFCNYRLAPGKSAIRTAILWEEGSDRELSRIESRFLPEIWDRIAEERSRVDGEFGPKRIPGQFYLKRWPTGTPIEAPACQQARAAGLVRDDFLSVLEPWRFLLFRK